MGPGERKVVLEIGIDAVTVLLSGDPEWRVRDLDEVLAVAGEHGLRLVERIAMPANNLSLIFRKVGVPGSGSSADRR